MHFQIVLDLLDCQGNFPGVGQAYLSEIWSNLSPDANLILNLPTADQSRGRRSGSSCNPEDAGGSSDLLPAQIYAKSKERRTLHFGRNLRLSYQEPLMICRGIGAYLISHEGRTYLDAYNNVPHVGHCHWEVVEAASQQMRLLNTNSRYLNEKVLEFAEQLLATFPSPLEVCFLVNSASEANELAIRLAREYTQARDMIVLEGAYHGHTSTLIDISPYKNSGPGGRGPADWVHTVPQADIYRGPFRDPATAGTDYAQMVADRVHELQRHNRRLCGFIAESCPSVGGQIIFPDNYLPQVYHTVREAGGVCIADDVQTGYGRLGRAFYGFELQHVVPDIAVLGKPIGNGYPLAAVITTRAIADAFDNGMEFFSTFGGNTVACAVGSKVLEIVQRDGLQQHALEVGNQLLKGFRELKEKFEIIGDVRGEGFFLGIELVRNHDNLEPADDEATFVVNRMKDRGVLIGTDGPLHNVIKVRPPMVFSQQDANRLVESLAACFQELPRGG